MKKSCDESNDGLTCFMVADKYYKQKNMKLAIEYITKSCDNNFSNACYNLGVLNFNGSKTVKKDEKKGIKLLEKACKLKSKEACKDLERINFSNQFTDEQIETINKAFEDPKLKKQIERLKKIDKELKN